MKTVFPMGSLMVMGESRATQSGMVLTSTTELATLVYCNEVIQVAKWSARKIPDKRASRKPFRLSPRSSVLCLKAAIGTRIMDASVKRQAAMTSDGTSSWAKRIKMDAVEAARIPNMMTSMGGNGGRLEEFISNDQL